MIFRDHITRADVGHYVIKRVRGGPLVPMKVFLGRIGGLLVEVAGEGVTVSKAPWPPAGQIDAAEYAYQMRLHAWRKSAGIDDRKPLDLHTQPTVF